MSKITYKLELNNKPNIAGEYGLLIRITKNRKHKRMALGHTINKKHWKKYKEGRGYYLSRSAPNYDAIMQDLDAKLNEARGYVIDNRRRDINPEQVQRKIKGEDDQCFFRFTDILIDRFKETGQINSWKKYKSKKNKLEEFVGKESLYFEEITVAFLNDYVHHLQMLKNGVNTIYNSDLKTIKTIYNKAIAEGITPFEKSPFHSFRLKSEKPNRARLIQEEIDQIIKLDLEVNSWLWHTRNYFLFSFYCAGIRFGDVARMTWENIKGERLIYKMGKTGIIKNIKLQPQAKEILALYDPKTKFVFPILGEHVDYDENPMYLFNQISSKNAIVNKYLKKIATKAEIDKNVSFHVSRHSFSNIARTKTNDLHSLKNLLGHSSLKITEAYLASFDEDSQDKALETIFG